MAAKKKPFTKFQCGDCKRINYHIRKSQMKMRKEGDQKLALKKFCSNCKKRTTHKEAKK